MSGLRAAEHAVAVSECELQRLLGLPRGRALEGDLAARADAARSRYRSQPRFTRCVNVEYWGKDGKMVAKEVRVKDAAVK